MNPYALLGALALLIATYFGGQYHGAKLERAEWQKEKLGMEAAHKAQIVTDFKQYASDVALHQRTARKASEDHEKALALQDQKHSAETARIRSIGGLRIPTTCPAKSGPAPSGQAAGAGGSDEGTTGTERLPEPIEQGLFDLVGDADKVSEQLRALQGWVRANGFYGLAQE